MILNTLEKEIEKTGGLSENQHGFQNYRSTTGFPINHRISTDAVMVIAGIIPGQYLIEERIAVYNSEEIDKMSKKNEARNEAMAMWQDEWNGPGKGGWTRCRLIGDIKQWVSRKHGEVNYLLTQFLSGHGCFNAYLNAIGKAPTDACRYCDETPDTLKHAIFTCKQ